MGRRFNVFVFRPLFPTEDAITSLLIRGVVISIPAEELLEKETAVQGNYSLEEKVLKDLSLSGDKIYFEDIETAAWKEGYARVERSQILPIMGDEVGDSERVDWLEKIIVFSTPIISEGRVGYFEVGPNSIDIVEFDIKKVFKENDKMLFLVKTPKKTYSIL